MCVYVCVRERQRQRGVEGEAGEGEGGESGHRDESG